jgi:hypothetical protein
MKFCFMNCIEIQMGISKNRKITFSKTRILFFYTEIFNNEIWEYTINKDSGELTAWRKNRR